MGAYVVINGVTYQLHGVLTPVGQASPSGVPPQDGQEWTPTMTANSADGFYASASSEYTEAGVSASAFKAFDGVAGAGWQSGWSSTAAASENTPQVLSLMLPQSKPLYTYSVQIRADANTLAPLAWALEGYDGTTWQELHSVAGLGWSNGEEKQFTVATPGVYAGYRWRITASGVLCQIAKIRLYS